MRTARILSLLVGLLLLVAAPAPAAVYTDSGPDPAAIADTVAAFKADLAAPNRQVTWDEVPDSAADPNDLGYEYFNTTNPQGFAFLDPGYRQFRVSATAASGTAPEFGTDNAGYPAELQPFSGERLLARRDMTSFSMNFLVPGERTAATVDGFGVVFSDVDLPGATGVQFYGADGSVLASVDAPVADKGLSFAGATFDTSQLAMVVVRAGNTMLISRRAETSAEDFVAMDDFVYGEPQRAPAYIQFAGESFRTTEGGRWFDFPIARSGTRLMGGGMGLEPIGGTATRGVDYDVIPFGYLLAGDTQSLTIQVRADAEVEGDETVVVRLTSPGYLTPGVPDVATLTIADGPPAPAPAAPADTVAPRLAALRASSGRNPRLTFLASEPSWVALRLQRLVPGRRVGRTCRRPTRTLRARAACTRSVPLRGVAYRVATAGANRLAIGRRFGGRRLAPGRYRAALTATDGAGNASRPLAAGFRLAK